MSFFLVFSKHGFVFPIYLFTVIVSFSPRHTDTCRDDAEESFQCPSIYRFLFYHHNFALIIDSSYPLCLIGRLQTDVIACPKSGPQLEFIRTVHFCHLNSCIVVCTYCQIIIRIGESLTTRKVTYLPKLVLVCGVNRLQRYLSHSVRIAPHLIRELYGNNLIQLVLIVCPRRCCQ